MPLIHGKSQKAFKKNVETEMEEHPGKENRAQNLAIAYAIKRRAEKHKMAHGGEAFHEDEMASGFVPHEENDVKHNEAAMHEDDRLLNQHGEHEEGPVGTYMAEGGFIGSHQTEEHMDDMVGRIMAQRQRMYSKGGMIANGGEDELSEMADGRPNNFDDLSMRDDLESSYDGDNAGDHLGNAQEDHDREDIVSRVMRSRAKKDRNPRMGY